VSLITDNEIKSIVKKHMSFAIFLVVVPIIFIQLIAFFSGDAQLNNLLFYIAPISSVGACGHFIQRVLIDINTNRTVNT
jgi:hypothetical protein|tara:strand:- start:613 stop:849 length:237 start_codon:yes stop_codon:yes gene_type:complete